MAELEELKKDISMYLELDTHKDFWKALSIVCDDELETARKNDAIEKAKSTISLHFKELSLKNISDKADIMRFAGNSGMHESINSDVHDIFHGKSSKELDELHASITAQIESGLAVDVEYPSSY